MRAVERVASLFERLECGCAQQCVGKDIHDAEARNAIAEAESLERDRSRLQDLLAQSSLSSLARVDTDFDSSLLGAGDASATPEGGW